VPRSATHRNSLPPMLRTAWWTASGVISIALAFTLSICSASASILRAESILPPGESGFVSTPGLADGSGSPHLYDQQQPFIDFQRKNDMLGLPAATTEDPRSGVHIARDQ